MKKILVFLGLVIATISCSSNGEYIEKIKQEVKKNALGVEMNYKSISFQWADTLTVKEELVEGMAEYEGGVNAILSAYQFSEDYLTKEKLVELRNWENEIRETPFVGMGEKYKNYEEFAFANRDASSFISDLCDHIEETDRLLNDWNNLEKGNLELIRNALWYYEREDQYHNSTPSALWGKLTTLLNALKEIQAENDRLSKMNSNEVIEYKALNNYTINNPLLNGAEVDVTNYFIFDKQLNIIRTEALE